MPTIAETISKVNSFVELPEGWHYGEGVSPTVEICQNATKLLRVADFLGITRANAFPGVDGQIQVNFYIEKDVLEFTLELDGTITIAEDEGNNQVGFKEGASWNTAFAKLREFSEKIWDSSESSTQAVMIQRRGNFLVRHLSRQATKESLLWNVIAPLRLVDHSVSISPSTIVIRPENLPFTGGYRTAPSQMDVNLDRSEVLQAMIATTTSTVGRRAGRGRRSRN